jgi:hypothetical protein
MTFDARTALLMALGAFTAFHVAVLAAWFVRARLPATTAGSRQPAW